MKLIANSLEEFCFGRKADFSAASSSERGYTEVVYSYIAVARNSILSGNNPVQVAAHFATDICRNKCVPWWRINGRNVDRSPQYLTNAGSVVFMEWHDAQAHCVKDYENQLSSKLGKWWSSLGLGVMGIKARCMSQYCFGRKPDAADAKKMEKDYKRALAEHKQASKTSISRKLFKSSEAVPTFIADICAHLCLPWWRKNAIIHNYITDSGELVTSTDGLLWWNVWFFDSSAVFQPNPWN